MKAILAMAAACALQLAATGTAAAETINLLHDDFSDGAIGTATGPGEVNGGFALQSVGAGVGSAAETGSLATVSTSSNPDSVAGLTSINSVDLAGLPSLSGGFMMTFVVDSVVSAPSYSGLFLGLTEVSSGDYRAGGNFGFNIHGSNTGTIGGVKLMSKDKDGGTRITIQELIPAGTYALADLQDGFTVSISVRPDNTYTYSISGLGPDVTGIGTLSVWDYAEEFGHSDYVVAAVHRNQTAVSVNLDRATVTATFFSFTGPVS